MPLPRRRSSFLGQSSERPAAGTCGRMGLTGTTAPRGVYVGTAPPSGFENEQPFRKAVEEEINSLYKVINDANLTKAELEEQMENMRSELRHLEQNHEQVAPPSHQKHTSYHSSMNLSPEEKQVEALKSECNDTGCKIQSLQAETESIRALKRGLENSLGDARHWHDMEVQNLGSLVSKLEAELTDVRAEIEQQRRDYDTLLGNKQRLEQEISLYHGILDGEERRFQPSELQ
ncbi:unnamed protein product [Lampetra planeri]